MKQTDLFEEIIVDNFAGGGGASTGIELAAGRPVTIAINHDPSAILLHRTNHPYTEHLQASVWDVDPVQVCRGRKVGLAWFSPDCKHFSKAKGAALVDRNIRGLAWIVLRWAGTVRPRVILLENVEEFQTWGPVRKGKPVKKKAGQTFAQWKRQLEDLGYKIEHRELVAADYGAPTTRKRFVLVARCDGKPIVWPKPTHGPRTCPEVQTGKLLPWRSAAEIIDWGLPCPSIFESKAEILEKYGLKAVRPLADNTMRRIIRGVDKFTIRSGEPFIVQQKFQNAAQDIGKPLTTVTAVGAHELCKPMLAPFTATNTSNSVGAPAGEPVHTVTTAGNQMLVTPYLAECKACGAWLGSATPQDLCSTCERALERLRGYIAETLTNRQQINEAPTVDAVPVVRCKECKWARFNMLGSYCVKHCGLAMITPDSFCSYGGRSRAGKNGTEDRREGPQ